MHDYALMLGTRSYPNLLTANELASSKSTTAPESNRSFDSNCSRQRLRSMDSTEEILFYYLKLRIPSNEQKIRQNTSR